MPTLYQKILGYGLLILILLIGGWSCQSASSTSGKRKATISQRFDKPKSEPAPQVSAKEQVKKSSTATKPKVTADPPAEKPTLFKKRTATANTPTQKSVIAVSPATSTPKSQLDLEFAIEQFKANQFEVAEYYLKKSLLASPDNPKTIRLLPWAYFFQKRYDKALMAFASAHTHFPKEAEPLIGMGWSYVSMKFYERALDKFKQAQSFSHDSYEVHKGLGFCNLFLGKEKAAQFHFKKIYVFAERDDLEEQWEQWQGSSKKLIEVAPSHIRTASLFTLDIETPRYRSMLSVFPDEQTETHPALEDAWRLYRKKLFQRALVAFQSLPQGVSQHLDARNGLAWSLLKTGNLIEAEKIFNDTWKQSGRFIGTRLGILEVKKFCKPKLPSPSTTLISRNTASPRASSNN